MAYLKDSSFDGTDKLNRFVTYSNTDNYRLLSPEDKNKLVLQALKISDKLDNSSLNLKLLLLLAEIKNLTRDYKSEEHILKQIIKKGEASNFKESFPFAYKALYFLEKRKGNPDSSFYYAKKLYDFAKSGNNKENKYLANVTLANYYQSVNKPQQAIDFLFTGMNLAKELNDIKMQISMNMRIGKIYLIIGDYQKSLVHRLNAVKLAESTSDTAIILIAKHRLGDTYSSLGRDKEALTLYKEILSQKNKYLSESRLTRVLESAGDLSLKTKNFDEALKYYSEEIQYRLKEKSNNSIAFTYTRLAKAYLGKGNLDSAETLFNKALGLISSKIYHDGYAEIYKGLSRIYNEKEDYKKAYNYLLIYTAEFDSLLFNQQIKQTAYNEAKFKYELEQKLQQERFQHSLQLRNYLIGGILMFAVVVTLFLILLLNSLKKQKESLKIINEQHEDIQKKNKSLEELNRIKNNYFKVLAHDLRSPFGTILQLSGIINNYSKENRLDDFREVTNLLESSSNRFNKLLESTLEWGQLQMEDIKIFKRKLNLADQIINAVNLLNLSADVKNIKIESAVETNLWVNADKDSLHGILINLISNSIKFSENDAKINITSQIITDNKVKVSVIDNGIGMSKDQIEDLLMGKFIKSEGTSGKSGAGFGLIISKKMIELNGGELFIKSNLNKGTTVSFTLELHNSLD